MKQCSVFAKGVGASVNARWIYLGDFENLSSACSFLSKMESDIRFGEIAIVIPAYKRDYGIFDDKDVCNESV